MTDYLRTGSLSLDTLLKGGWQRGCIHEIWGGPSTGKSMLAKHAIRELLPEQKAVWISLGTELPSDFPRILVSQPRNAEEAFLVMEMTAPVVALLVIDSANGLIRQRELDDDPEYSPHPQREYKDELNTLKRTCAKSGAAALFLSRPREHDRPPLRGTGISEKARSRVRLELITEHQDGSREIESLVKGVKETGKFLMRPGTGIDRADELARLAINTGVAVRRRAWVRYGNESFHGIADFAEHLARNAEVAATVEKIIRHKAGIA